jgi:hypothetical protein
MEIKAHSEARDTRLEKEDAKKRFKYSALREQTYYIRKRACNVIRVNAEKFTAKLTCE